MTTGAHDPAGLALSPPPRDPRYHCAFGHEHGSNPRAFRYFARMGMPAFGLVSDYAGSPEAHAKILVDPAQRGDDVLGTGLGPGRATVEA